MEILSKGKNDTLVKLFNHSKIKSAQKNAIASRVKPTAVGGMSRTAICSLMSLELHVYVHARATYISGSRSDQLSVSSLDYIFVMRLIQPASYPPDAATLLWHDYFLNLARNVAACAIDRDINFISLTSCYILKEVCDGKGVAISSSQHFLLLSENEASNRQESHSRRVNASRVLSRRAARWVTIFDLNRNEMGPCCRHTFLVLRCK